LEASGRFDEVIVHEMGHVVGFGTIWPTLGLLADPSLSGGTDPHFTGSRAIEAFDRIGGATYTGNKVPVENIGGSGTADAHWRESVFSNELMTGFINSGANPLSEVTVASLWDMGYTVNLDGAEDFSISSPLRAFGAPVAVLLVDDVVRGPIYVVDGAGRVVGVIRER
ncbi:MAG: leishmanolysin-related zinc metalloendopeptidase, partial [Gemmatimonadales bacterium]